MKTLLIATALTLLAAARARAAHMMETLAHRDAGAARDEDFSANGGGWN